MTARSTTWTLWAMLALTVAVCGLGIYHTVLQYRAVRDLLLESERRQAEEVTETIPAQLDKLEGEAAGALAELLADDRGNAREHRSAARPSTTLSTFRLPFLAMVRPTPCPGERRGNPLWRRAAPASETR